MSTRSQEVYDILTKCPDKLCHECAGKGVLLDHAAVGAEMRSRRESAGLSLRTVAKRLGVSAPYISDLERGNRNWSLHRIEDYLDAINPAHVAEPPFKL